MTTFYIKNTHIYIRDILEDDLYGSNILAEINSTI